MVDLIKLRNMQNNLFFTPHVIFNRVSKVHRNKILEYSLGDFISWCYELENEILTDVEAMIAFEAMQLGFPDPNDSSILTIEAGMVPVPRFIHRIKRIYDENSYVLSSAGYNGAYIFLPQNSTSTKVFISGYMIPYDPETNSPLMLKGHEQAAYHFCVHKMYEEDVILGKMPMNTAMLLESNKNNAIAEAASAVMRLVTQDDYVNYAHIMMDLSPDLCKIIKQ